MGLGVSHLSRPGPRAGAEGRSQGLEPRAGAEGRSRGPEPGAEGRSRGPGPRAGAEGRDQRPRPRAGEHVYNLNNNANIKTYLITWLAQ